MMFKLDRDDFNKWYNGGYLEVRTNKVYTYAELIDDEIISPLHSHYNDEYEYNDAQYEQEKIIISEGFYPFDSATYDYDDIDIDFERVGDTYIGAIATNF